MNISTKEDAIAGPFKNLQSELCHISPLMSRPKGIHARRVILDLLCGEGDSVNGFTPRGFCDSKQYELTLPNLDCLI